MIFKNSVRSLFAIFVLLGGPAIAQVSYTGNPYFQDFNGLQGVTNNVTEVTWTDNESLPGWYASKPGYHVTDGTMGGSAANFDSTGNANNIGLISFGTSGSSDRALGSRATSTTSLGSSNAPVRYGIRLRNDTPNTITNFSFTFTGEQWYASTQSAAHTLELDYQLGATSLTSGTWSSSVATFTAPISTGTTARSLNGNSTANRRPVIATVTGISWAPGQDLWIRVQDNNESGNEQGLALDDFTFWTGNTQALFFDGINDYVTMGTATSTLGASNLTLECWFMRTGTGVTTSTGTGGVTTVIPLVTKGRGEADGDNRDCNYFLGIDAATNKLAADFETAPAAGLTSGQNYPILGSTLIEMGRWYHAAVTYDVTSATWKLYVNGIEDATVTNPAGAAPRADSIQHFALGSALTSTGSAAGYFNGVISEVRVWGKVRSALEIAEFKEEQITDAETGLLARYGLMEGTGTTVAGLVAGSPAGSLTNGPMWTQGRIWGGNLAPVVSISSPTNASEVYANAPVVVTVSASDLDGAIAEVELLVDGVSAGIDDTVPYSFEVAGLSVGPHSFSARATDDAGAEGVSGTVNVTAVFDPLNPPANAALWFDGVDDHVTMGVAPELCAGGPPSHGLTIECWFRKEGSGVTSSSGNGGVSGVPLFGKGRGESENSNLDCNYFFAINTSGLLVADFEAYPAAGITAGQNYPIIGTHAAIQNNVWYHAAAAYDGNTSTWKLYLNGVEVGSATLPAGALPRYDSIQHFAIATAMTSTGGREGAFAGRMDEIRVWSYARSESEIFSAKDYEIASASGLVGRFGLNEASGTTVANSAGAAPTGTLVNGPLWVEGVTFAGFNEPPTAVLTAPIANYSAHYPYAVTFAATAEDTNGTIAKVEFFVGGVKVGEDTEAPYQYDWVPSGVGDFSVNARAVDNLGAAGISAAVDINITPNPNQPPAVSLTSPLNGAVDVGTEVMLQAGLADPEGDAMAVTFYGRTTPPPTPGPDFTLMTLPDTQFYSQNTGGTRIAQYLSQTNWIVSQRDALNIAFVTHLGDIAQDGDAIPQQWVNANEAMSILEPHTTTLRPYGIPWGSAPGNHDQSPIGNPDGTTTYYNQYFGVDRFQYRHYWGGNFGTDNDNNYQLFSASGLDFIILHIEYRTSASTAVLDWADAVLKAYPNRRAIVSSHWLIGTGNPASFQGPGQAIYNRLRENPNLFLTLCGHVDGEGQRTDVYDGHTVYSVLQDYQGRANGGSGWLRYFVFSPANNTITARTYSTTLDQHETDANSQFILPYNMQGEASEWVPLGSVNVTAGGTTANLSWTGLEPGKYYEWYAVAHDGISSGSSTARPFSTAENQAPSVTMTSPADNAALVVGGTITLTATASDSDGTIAKVEFFDGITKLGEDTTTPYEYAWTGAALGNHGLSVVAVDNQGKPALSNMVSISVSSLSNVAPTVAITAPANDALFSAPATISLQATASDADGSVTKVEFFNGATKLGESTNIPYTYEWTNVGVGNYALTAVATDNGGSQTTSTTVNISVGASSQITFVSRGAVWKYLDDGSNQGTDWKEQAFNDSTWASGPAELGYGDGGEATELGYGPDSNNKYPAYYFRRAFTVADPAAITGLNLTLKRDDGAVVYINGTEVLRDNMPAGDILYNTYASSPEVSGSAESTFFSHVVDPSALRAGVNTIAVEIHQQRAVSSDISFDMDLIGNQSVDVNAAPVVTLTAPTDQAVLNSPVSITLSATASDNDGSVSKVEFYRGTTKIDEDTSAPYEVIWSGPVSGVHALSAIAIDNLGLAAASSVVTITVNGTDNQAPTVALTSPSNNASFDALASIQLIASAEDVDGEVTKVEFYNGATKLGEDLSAPYELTWSGVMTGSYVLTAVATDGDGGETISSVVNVTVTNVDNVAPTASITTPANNASIAGSVVNITSNVADTDGVVTKVEFYNGINKLGESITSPYSFNWTGVAAGSYALTVVATDNDGGTTTSSVVNVTTTSAAAVFTYTQNFDGMGTSGTTPPTGWAIYGNMGGSNTTWTNATGIPASDMGAGTLSSTLSATTSYTSTSNSNGFNYAQSGSTSNRALGLSPTSGKGTALQLTLTNTVGAPISTFNIGYELRRFSSVNSTNELPGYRLFYSLDNGSTWTNVSELNPVVSGGSVNVPNTTGTTTVPLTTVYLATPWAVDASIRFRWVDDNATETSPDQVYGLDNLTITTAGVNSLPTVALTAPSNNASFTLPTTIHLTANAADTDGSVTKVEFLANGSKIGEDTSAPFEYDWNGMVSGAYALTARAIDDADACVTSSTVNITVTNPGNLAPTVAITSPANNSLIPASSLNLEVATADSDGVITKVEYFNGATKLGESSTAPFTFTWVGVAVGTHTLTAVATDNDDGTTTSAVVTVEATAFTDTTAISRGTTWKYLDDGSDQGTAWSATAFNDGTWASGTAKLGYQDGAVTVLREGPDGMTSSTKFITYYFRKSFTVADASQVLGLKANLLRDDAAVVYLNGVEVARSNMPEGPVNYLTQSVNIVSSSDETTYFPLAISKASLVSGENVIAVEVHQRDNSSSDLGFDLDLITTMAGGNALPVVQITAPTEEDTFFPGSDITITATAQDSDGAVTKVEFFNGSNKLGEDATAPYEFVWNSVAAGSYPLTAVATDDIGSTGTSAVVNLTITPGQSGTLTRVPYIQQGTSTSMIIRWRSSQSVVGRVRYGTSPTSLNQFVNEAASGTEHTVKLIGLNPYTRYYYSVGSASDVLAGGDAGHTFVTSPVSGTPVSTRIWVLGDPGTADNNQRAVRDAFYTWTGSRTPDFWIMLGDNAYNNGTQTEFQNAVFGIYPTMLNKSPLWSCIGNHETYGGTEANGQYPYQNIHEFPTNGEAGGVASGTEKYFSWDYGHSHFISLDSMTSSRAANGAMANWLRDDLAATTKTWIICIFHHPPYTKGSHNSDSESELIQMRQNILPILEEGGVDLVLCGHSHCYERSHFMDGHYGVSSTYSHATHRKQTGNGRPASDGAYIKPLTGPRDHFGAIYAVAGSSGKISGGSLNHAAMFLSLNNLGSMVLDINENRLDATFLRENGSTPDSFTILKQGAADSDKDGISDEYEIANGLNRFSASDANLDSDKDGLTNLEEFLFGLQSGVADHYAWTTTQDEVTGDYTICYPTLAGRTYQVFYSPDLLDWQPASGVVTGDGSLKCWTDDGTGNTPNASRLADKRFYRVKVTLVP